MSHRLHFTALFVLFACLVSADSRLAASADTGDLPDVVVVKGGMGEGDPLAPAFEMLASRSSRVFLRGQRCRSFAVCARHKDDDFSVIGKLASLLDSLPTSSAPLLLHLVGHGEKGEEAVVFRTSAGAKVLPGQLNSVLDSWQKRSGRAVVLVLDFCHAGGFAAKIDVHQGNRLVLFSCRAEEQACFAVDGFFSYSEFLLDGIIEGTDVLEAHLRAKRLLSGWQEPGQKGGLIAGLDNPEGGGGVSLPIRKGAGALCHSSALDHGYSPGEARHRALLVTRLLTLHKDK